MTADDELLARVQEYLSLGGLFNPEAMRPQDAVRDLIMDQAAAIRSLQAQLEDEQQRGDEWREQAEVQRKAREALETELNGWREGAYHGF